MDLVAAKYSSNGAQAKDTHKTSLTLSERAVTDTTCLRSPLSSNRQ